MAVDNFTASSINWTADGNGITCNSTGNFTNGTGCSESPAGATILSPVLMSLTGVLGNILALFQLYKTRTDVRTTKFYSLIAGVAWTDLLGILLTSPSVILVYVNNRQWVGGDAHCRFHGFTMVTFGLATPFIICAMAVERFLALKCVFFYSSRCRTETARGCILIIWFGVILYGLLPLFGFGKFEKQYPGTWCYMDFHSENTVYQVYGYIYACTNLLLILIIFLCNAYVMVTIFKTRFKRDRSESAHALSHNMPENDGLVKMRTARRKSNDSDIQMIVLLCAITVVFTVCWAPLMLRIMVTQATGVTNHLLDLAAVRLASLNQTLDPWLYILLRRSACLKLSRGVRRIKTKCLKVIGAQKSDIVENNDERKSSNPNEQNGALHQGRNCNEGLDNKRQKDMSSPDVMQNNACGNRSPLPDITNHAQNKDPGYVCHFQFGKSVSPKQEDGMYVKIMYLQNNSPVNAYVSKHPGRPLMCCQVNKKQFMNNFNIPLSTPPGNPCKHEDNTTFQTKSSGSGTKETTLSQDNNADFRSEAPIDPACTRIIHQSLRKTRSSNR